MEENKCLGCSTPYFEEKVCDCCKKVDRDETIKKCFQIKGFWICIDCAKNPFKRKDAFGNNLFE